MNDVLLFIFAGIAITGVVGLVCYFWPKKKEKPDHLAQSRPALYHNGRLQTPQVKIAPFRAYAPTVSSAYDYDSTSSILSTVLAVEAIDAIASVPVYDSPSVPDASGFSGFGGGDSGGAGAGGDY